MKQVNHKDKVGLALSESELEDIITCVDEVQQRMDTNQDKGWGTRFNIQVITRLKSLKADLYGVLSQYKKKETGVVNEYEGLPEENCEVCD